MVRRFSVASMRLKKVAPDRVRLVAEIPETLLDRVDNWAVSNGYRTRWEAISYLLTQALNAEERQAARAALDEKPNAD
jgi:metal-responsive CopG/Arc/MetJ family transcriptional regulator